MTGNVAEKQVRHGDTASAKESPCDVLGQKILTEAFETGRDFYFPKGFRQMANHKFGKKFGKVGKILLLSRP